ncbi:helix-turn-helix transcriptional regulator [Anaerocolumna sp. MB42-C2]|uniref:helix-turn-helix transcriptional regulator n=1 Tax=Anaerocolumna sp. MB42-C2 TaxID=3070997 RepID=UPI0027DED014|nr:helix-turn-helix transcriptional regulator [Anaerocolumna sp. MB42-C2]WMJ88364.1 helix-turn-helix transcriptional regulator [Anaerocolumna sp. MB42-C2]
MSDKLFTPQEVADLLKIKKNTVYELIKRGDLKCRKIGKQLRIRNDDLEEYLNAAKSESLEKEIYIQHSMESEKTNEFQNMEEMHVNPGLERREEITRESYNNRGVIICGQDILLEILCNYLSVQFEELPIFRSYLGSYNGLYSLYQGKVDVATAHLWDGETGEYNKEYVKKMLPGIPYRRIHLVSRMLGFYVRAGNPKQIKDFKDLVREDVIMINREKGSGTRILLDQYLLKMGIKTSQIKGYEKEVTSHLACAGAVARGSVDVSMGNERNSKELKGIEFIPIQMESYDMVVKMEATRYSWYHTLVQIINSREFKEELEGLSGYDITDIGKILD